MSEPAKEGELVRYDPKGDLIWTELKSIKGVGKDVNVPNIDVKNI